MELDNSESNFYDDLVSGFDPAEALKQQQNAKAEGEKLDYLIHKVFQQNKDGQELLAIWKEALIMKPIVEPGQDMANAGINEGMMRFIRGIILTIKRVEQD